MVHSLNGILLSNKKSEELIHARRQINHSKLYYVEEVTFKAIYCWIPFIGPSWSSHHIAIGNRGIEWGMTDIKGKEFTLGKR